MPRLNCTDFFEMCNTILEYVNQHGGKVLLNDDVYHRQIGYVVTTLTNEQDEPWWVIDIGSLKASIFNGTLPKEDLEKLSNIMKEVYGRSKVGWALGEGYLPWIDWDRFDKSHPRK
jgi:hypothetical protein